MVSHHLQTRIRRCRTPRLIIATVVRRNAKTKIFKQKAQLGPSEHHWNVFTNEQLTKVRSKVLQLCRDKGYWVTRNDSRKKYQEALL